MFQKININIENITKVKFTKGVDFAYMVYKRGIVVCNGLNQVKRKVGTRHTWIRQTLISNFALR